MTLLHKVTWSDKAHPQRVYRGDVQNKREKTWWNTLVYTPQEDLTVIKARTMPVIEGYTDFSSQVYTKLPGDAEIVGGKLTGLVVPGTRPLSVALRFFRLDAGELDGENETAVAGPFVISQLAIDAYWSYVHPTFLKTHPDNPVGVQFRYTGGPEYFDFGNRILKGWERPA